MNGVDPVEDHYSPENDIWIVQHTTGAEPLTDFPENLKHYVEFEGLGIPQHFYRGAYADVIHKVRQMYPGFTDAVLEAAEMDEAHIGDPFEELKIATLREGNDLTFLLYYRNPVKTVIPMVGGGCRRKPYGWNTRKVKKSPFRNITRAKRAERNFHTGSSIGFTARSSLKSMGRIPRASGCYLYGKKYS